MDWERRTVMPSASRNSLPSRAFDEENESRGVQSDVRGIGLV